MSAEAVGWVYKHSPYKGSQFAIHLALADSANDMHNHEIWARQQWIADKARTVRQTVNTFLNKAIEDGYLVILQNNSKSGHANRYRLLMPSDAPQVWSPKSVWNESEDTEEGVATDDTPPKGGVATDDTPVSPQTTGGVATDDTEPKTTQSVEPNHDEPEAHPAPSSPDDAEAVGLDQDSQAESADARANAREDTETGSGGERGGKRVKYDTSGYAHDLCLLLQRKVREQHSYNPAIKNSNASGWVATMNRLITKGPPGREEPEPVDPEKIRVMIEYIYTYGTEGSFRWADQITSPHDLTKHWDKLRAWANRLHQERSKEQRAERESETNEAWMVRSKRHG